MRCEYAAPEQDRGEPYRWETNASPHNEALVEDKEMSRVFVMDAHGRPLAPCTPARARLLLKQHKAAVLRRFPFTLILKEDKI